jgi:hypothetical protein
LIFSKGYIYILSLWNKSLNSVSHINIIPQEEREGKEEIVGNFYALNSRFT